MNHIKYIDGLRAVAVLSVIFFHFGLLSKGYLGVDVFFVISGFLITRLIYRESRDGFSIKDFYLRRIRRIIPLVSCVSFLSVVIGLFVMLPNDLKTLAQSVVATTLFSNNMLQAITTGNYWDVVNEFKPLMHTWSLGVEEQYYFLYPLLFMIFTRKRLRFILSVLIFLTVSSLALFFLPTFGYASKFYYLPFRFFELASGGIAAIFLETRAQSGKVMRNVGVLSLNREGGGGISIFFLTTLGLLLSGVLGGIPDSVQLCLVVLSTCMLFVFTKEGTGLTGFLLENRPVVFVGAISFSLYMWHQFVLAFGRYFMFSEMTVSVGFVMLFVIFSLSIASYYYIEQPFRKKQRIGNKWLFSILLPLNALVLLSSVVLHLRGGVVRDVPELDITCSYATSKMHSAYNDRIYSHDREFETGNKLKILLVGDSFARDFANILLETKHGDEIDLSYVFDHNNPGFERRARIADLIFFSRTEREKLDGLNLDFKKVYCVGTKNFGISNGIFYNYRGPNFYQQRTPVAREYIDSNEKLKKQWNDHYVDLLDVLLDANGTVPVFTPEHKFISQDCRHLLRTGARYYAHLLDATIETIVKRAK